MRDRVRPARELEPALDLLKELGMFETKQKGMMFAAALGFAICGREKKGEEMDSAGEGIRLEYFSNVGDHHFIDALAVTAEGDLGVVDPDRTSDRIELFERYAKVGLAYLKVQWLDAGRDVFESILAVVDRYDKEAVPAALPGLDDPRLNRVAGLI